MLSGGKEGGGGVESRESAFLQPWLCSDDSRTLFYKVI